MPVVTTRRRHAKTVIGRLCSIGFPPSSQELLRSLKPVLVVAKQAIIKRWILNFEHHNPHETTRVIFRILSIVTIKFGKARRAAQLLFHHH